MDLTRVAPAFVEMAHRIVWATARLAGLRLEPWRLRVQPAAVLLAGAADQRLTWSS